MLELLARIFAAVIAPPQESGDVFSIPLSNPLSCPPDFPRLLAPSDKLA
jgi:hypothetical protein